MKPKYGNIKTNGYDSKKEAAYAAKLELLRNASNPSERVVKIEKQVRYQLIPSQRIGGKVVERACHYVADFCVEYADGRKEVIDVKSKATESLPVFVMKRKLMLHVFNIQIKVV